MGAATTTALAHPGAWPVALVGVLVRGGLVTLVLPIVVLPTTIGLATALGPAIVAIALGQPDAGVARLVALVVGSAIGWLLVSALLGAWTDTWLIAWLAADLEEPSAGAPNGPAATGPPAEVRGGTVLRVVVVRAIAHLPLLVAAGWGFARLVEVARLELILPSDLRVPIVVRVALGAPEVFALIALTWVVGEALGALAARTVVLERASSAQALLQAAASAVRHLPATAATLLVATVGWWLLVLPSILAATVAWAGLRGVLLGDGTSFDVVLGALALAFTWLGGLLLAGVAAAWQSALWTAEALRRRGASSAGHALADPGGAVSVSAAPPSGNQR